MYEKKQEGGGPLRSLPNIDLNYIKNRATDTSKVVRKAQEVPDVNHIKNWLLSNNKERDLFDYCGALLTKSKLKHFCKRMGHSRILGKMASLQKSAGSHNEDDAGFRALNTRAEAETEYISRYRNGEVESKKSVFEPRLIANNDLALSPASLECQPAPSFSWSLHFDKDLPVRADSYSVAQKHNQVCITFTDLLTGKILSTVTTMATGLVKIGPPSTVRTLVVLVVEDQSTSQLQHNQPVSLACRLLPLVTYLAEAAVMIHGLTKPVD